MRKLQWKPALTAAASFLLSVWAGLKLVIDSLGRVLVYQDFSKPDSLVAHGLVWLFKTPWWVPGVIAALLAAGLLIYLFHDGGDDKTEIRTPQPVIGTPSEHYVVERTRRLEEEVRLRDVELREREDREKGLAAEFQSLQRKHKAGQNTLEKWIELFGQSTELRTEASTKWQEASEVIAAIDAILGDSGSVAGKGLLGGGAFDADKTVSASEKVERARDVIWAFYEKRASQLPSPPGAYFESVLDQAAQRLSPYALPGIQQLKPVPSAPLPAIAAPTIPPVDLDAQCPCASGKTYGSCHGRSDPRP